MPSRARIRARDQMLPQIDLLLEAHKELRKGKKGPDNHNSIVRSAIVLLCAAWKIYCEAVTREAKLKLLRAVDDVGKLPESVQKQLVQAVHHENVWKFRSLKVGWEWLEARSN